MSIKNPTAEQISLTLKALRNSIYDGVFAHLFANLTGSMFLPAFALVLGASAVEIGVLAAAPFFATVVQFFGAFLVEKYNQRKRMVIVFALLSRIVWLVVIAASLLLSLDKPAVLLLILILVVLSHHALASITSIAWLSWMSVLVPDEIRGRFFGLRNATLGAFNIALTLLAGRFLDWHKLHYPDSAPTQPFDWLFTVAVFCGLLSVIFLVRKPAPPRHVYAEKITTGDLYKLPLLNISFRRLAWFAAFWSVGVKIASPFFIVYMLQVLHFDYSFIAILIVSSAFADMAGMWMWGQFSDRLGNKPVVVISGVFISVIPMLWFISSPDLPHVHLLIIVLHLVSGFFWAGFNLCSVNLVFAIAPKERNTGYFAHWAAFNGVASGIGAILGGLAFEYAPNLFMSLQLSAEAGFKSIFIISAALRFASLLLLKNVTDPRGKKTMRAIRILRNVKTWAGLMGFDGILHYFLPAKKPKKQNGRSPYWPIWRFGRSKSQ
ncbi:MAG: MFS transporter [Deferribacteres bacterium]|nr:MFS transporter [candidate division KSB1 bacterium]MCB9510726.1 MFS transporter [Deferribacteres bacterium]